MIPTTWVLTPDGNWLVPLRRTVARKDTQVGTRMASAQTSPQDFLDDIAASAINMGYAPDQVQRAHRIIPLQRT